MKTIDDFEKLYGPMRPVSFYVQKYGPEYFEIILDSWNWLRKMKPKWKVAWIQEDDDTYFDALISKIQARECS